MANTTYNNLGRQFNMLDSPSPTRRAHPTCRLLEWGARHRERVSAIPHRAGGNNDDGNDDDTGNDDDNDDDQHDDVDRDM